MVVEPAVDMATEEATEPWAVVPWAEPGASLPSGGRRALLAQFPSFGFCQKVMKLVKSQLTVSLSLLLLLLFSQVEYFATLGCASTPT